MKPKRELFYHDPRLHMTIFGRQLVRIVSALAQIFLLGVTGAFLVSDLGWLRWLAVFLVLFLVDRAFHFREGDEAIPDLSPEGRVNIAAAVSTPAYSALEDAFDECTLTKENYYLHLLRILQKRSDVKDALRRLDVSVEEFLHKTEELIQVTRIRKIHHPERLLSAETVVRLAFGWAQREGHRFVEPGALFAALARIEDEPVLKLFMLFNIRPEDAERAVSFGMLKREMRVHRVSALREIVMGRDRGLPHRIMNRAWTSRPTPTLDKFSEDLTDLARSGRIGFMIGHTSEYRRLLEVVARPLHPNALLLGEPGIGSDVIVNHLAFDLARDQVPSGLFDKRLVRLEISTLVANAEPNVLQDRVQKVAAEITRAGNIILFIPDVHLLLRTSGSGFLSVADALVPILMNSNFPVIGATFPREFHEIVEPRSDMLAAFNVIRVEEITPPEAERVLTFKSVIWEREHKVFISFGAVKTAVDIAHEFVLDKFLPSSAEEILKSALVAAEAGGVKEIGPELVRRVVGEELRVPLRSAEGEEAEKLLHLEDRLKTRVIGQDEAVRVVSEAIRQYRTGLADGRGPIASFLFVGPTGVGKTELSRALAATQFGSEESMVRLDMTEFRDAQAVARLIGTTGGSLVEQIRARPHSLILLDEFEKCSAEVQNLFLQVLDDGRLTDSLGRTVSFQHSIVIATSNAHSELILNSLSQGESAQSIAEYVKRRLTEVFKPELLNRFTRIVVFRSLEISEVKRIAELQLRALAAQAKDRGVTLVFDDAALTEIAKRGYDPAFGVRPLRRAIASYLREPIAEKLLDGRARRGGSLHVSAVDGEFRFVTSLSYVEDIRSDV